MLNDVVVGDVRPALWALFVAVALVLLIASANVASLLLIRGEARRGELSVRIALGASRTGIVRQFLVESLMLGLVASVVGLLVAWWSLPALLALAPDRLPRVDVVQIDPSVVLFAAGIMLVTTMLAGLAPALSTQAGLMSPLRGSGRSVSGAPGGARALVVAQVALAVIVVAAATLVTRGLVSLQRIDVGVADDRLCSSSSRSHRSSARHRGTGSSSIGSARSCKRHPRSRP